MRPTQGGGIFDMHTNYPSVKTNPNYTSEKWENAGENVREAFSLLLGLLKLNPDQAIVDFTGKMVEDEYASFSESERDMYAYFSSTKSRGLSGISNDSTGDPIMRANPAYWNKSLPRSAIQIFLFYYPADKNFLRNEKEQQLKDNNGEYHISRFIEGLDINTLIPLIDR